MNSSLTLKPYLELIRFDRPIGTLLLLWPTYWALWLAGNGNPDPGMVLIFGLGAFLTRSAGCVINDYADRHLDGSVARTQQRPLVSGLVSEKQALLFALTLAALAFILVLLTNLTTILLSFGALALAVIYPFCKRVTHLPQVVLGMAFSWGIPMAFTAQTGKLPPEAWLIFVINLLWTIMYDTIYAMVDRDDDIKVGIKSTAILLGRWDRTVIALLQISVLAGLLAMGSVFGLGIWYTATVVIGAGLFSYQQWLIRKRERASCFAAFLNNNWVGAAVFIGIILHYVLIE